jgi:hypothetical protein
MERPTAPSRPPPVPSAIVELDLPGNKEDYTDVLDVEEPERDAEEDDMAAGTASAATVGAGVTAAVWSKTVDPESGDTYYYNSETGDVQWDEPAGFEEHVYAMAGKRSSLA